MYFGTNVYGWTQLAKRDGREWSLPDAMAQAKRAGIRGWEGAFRQVAEVQVTADAARAEGLEMHSAYVFGAYHEEELAERAAENALAISEALRAQGVYRIIINPDPLPGGAPKTDARLLMQSSALDRLGATLAAADTGRRRHEAALPLARPGDEERRTRVPHHACQHRPRVCRPLSGRSLAVSWRWKQPDGGPRHHLPVRRPDRPHPPPPVRGRRLD